MWTAICYPKKSPRSFPEEMPATPLEAPAVPIPGQDADMDNEFLPTNH
jgi:hypothetical protein